MSLKYLRKRGTPLDIMRSYDELLNHFDREIHGNERDGMKKIVRRYEMLYCMADQCYDILCKYFDKDLVEDVLCLASSGFIKWSEIVSFCEIRSLHNLKLFDDETQKKD